MYIDNKGTLFYTIYKEDIAGKLQLTPAAGEGQSGEQRWDTLEVRYSQTYKNKF